MLAAVFTAAAATPKDYSIYKEKAGGAPYIVIDKPALLLTMLDADGHIIKQCGISCAKVYGNKQKRGDGKTPEGVFKINEILRSDYLSHDFRDGKGPVKGAYGPWFLRLDVPGFIDIGIHGTHKPESIGTRDTEGCIRVKNNDILEIKDAVRIGTPVVILPDSL